MKYLFLIFFCSILSFVGAAQTGNNIPESVLAKIVYKFKHINDTNDRSVFIQDETVTYLAKNTSFYTTHSGYDEEKVSQQINSASFDGNVVILKSTAPIKQYIYLNLAIRELKTLHVMMRNDFLVVESFPTLDWHLTNEKKEIGGYLCQKANTSYKGRNYTAWFTEEIPFSFGPWKLHGLPGLIVEAYDDKKEVIFEYAGFDLIEDKNMTIGIPEGTRIDKLEDVQKLEQIKTAPSFTNLESIKIQILAGKEDGGLANYGIDKIKSISINNAPGYTTPNKTNNPIELTN